MSTAVKPRPAATIGTTLFLAIFAAYFLVPIWWLLMAATKTRGDLITSPGLWLSDSFRLFDNLGELLTRDGGVYPRWLLNSALYAGAGAAFGTLLAAMAGYALAKYVFPGRDATFNIILSGVLVPATALALPLFLMFSKVGVVDTYWSVLLPSMVSPFGVYLARIYAAASVPEEVLEAARLDGSSEVRTFFTVSIRLMAPAVVTIFLFQFVAVWNNFFLPLVMLQNQRLYPVTLGLYFWNSQVTQDPNLQMMVIAGALLSIVPLIVAFLALQRFWRSGLAAGSSR